MEDPNPPTDPYEQARREAARMRLWLNGLVILSAAASSIFLVYVVMKLIPRGEGQQASDDVPVSAVREKIGVLRGQAGDVAYEVRDVDEAAGYREKLSEQLRQLLGVRETGRLYVFSVRNAGKSASIEFSGGTLTLREKSGVEHVAQWLPAVAKPESNVGRMTLAQSEAKFTLAPGERRELYVFLPAKGDLPAAADLAGGTVEAPGLGKAALEHVDVNIGR